MNCKDCIHYEVCAIEVVLNTAINENCNFFKDKSKIIELPYTPIPVIHDSTEFNTDVYCPNCGTNLSCCYTDGIEESLCVIQCYNCGIICDNTKSVKRIRRTGVEGA